MLLAIDLGNTNLVAAVHDGSVWRETWRRRTNVEDTPDEIAVWLRGAFRLAGLDWAVDHAICGSVVPAMDGTLAQMTEKWLRVPLSFLRTGLQVGLEVSYDPPHAVGADRLANALAALDTYTPPIVVVDFGTATTFDCVDRDGVYAGGAIMPGVRLSGQALSAKAAKLPPFPFDVPERAVGRNTVESMQSGVMFGFAGAVEALLHRITAELGSPRVVATGGLGGLFVDLCPSIESYRPMLTLDGLRIAAARLAP